MSSVVVWDPAIIFVAVCTYALQRSCLRKTHFPTKTNTHTHHSPLSNPSAARKRHWQASKRTCFVSCAPQWTEFVDNNLICTPRQCRQSIGNFCLHFAHAARDSRRVWAVNSLSKMIWELSISCHSDKTVSTSKTAIFEQCHRCSCRAKHTSQKATFILVDCFRHTHFLYRSCVGLFEI